MNEILEMRKADIFILLETAHQFMLHTLELPEEDVAKILAVIFVANKWSERIVNEFGEFVMAMGGYDGEQEKIKLN